jgi:hypothetical protein
VFRASSSRAKTQGSGQWVIHERGQSPCFRKAHLHLGKGKIKLP